MAVTSGDNATIVDYWRAVELFSPQTVESVNPRNDVFRGEAGKPLPWQHGHEIGRRRQADKQRWRHTIYLGIYQLEDTYELLKEVFPPPEGSYDERPPGESAVAALVVTDEGRPLFGSENLSSAAWCAGRTIRHRRRAPEWLGGFGEAQRAFGEMVEEWFAPLEHDEVARELAASGVQFGRPICIEDLDDLADTTVRRLGLARSVQSGRRRLISREVRIRSVCVGERDAYRVDDTDFLNSFVADDLARVAAAVRGGRCGTALRQYLRSEAAIDSVGRVDVESTEGLRFVHEATAPDRVPLGRWPGVSTQPLALSQQLAVNHVLTQLGTRDGLVGVDGPPGTGKTTMIRDLVAGLVVERARRLASLDDPNDAFVDKRGYESGEVRHTLRGLRDDLTGFEMVVASSNNAAVENVTQEIPGDDAIASEWTGAAAETDYFVDIATAVLNADNLHGDRENWTQAWGLVAAVLGNRRNCKRFAQAFWWGDEPDPKGRWLGRDATRQVVQAWANRPPSAGTWREAVASFRSVCAEAERLRDERVAVYRAFAEMESAHRRLDEADRAVAQARTVAARRREQLATRNAELREADERLQNARERELHHTRASRPGFWQIVLTLGRDLRDWKAEHVPYAAATQTADMAAHELRADVASLSAQVAEADERASAWVRVQDQARQQLTVLEERVAAATEALGGFVPDARWWDVKDSSARRDRELCALWTDPGWNHARSAVFLAALALHKEFVRHTARRLRGNLQMAIRLLTGSAPTTVPEQDALTAWQSLFLVVPVISTTFASVGRLFAHLGPAALGWLMIDEAGQATPQSAVGALWRCRRVVAVGDPLQLEPIVGLPFTVQDALREDYGVERRWLPSHTSVQRIADEHTAVGSWIPGLAGDESRIWVGCPLKVHRRCREPMFSLVNDEVYGGLMIHATADGERDLYDALPESAWLDVCSNGSDGHWVPDEGERLDDLLGQLRDGGVDLADVLVVGPFRTVAKQIEQRGWDRGRPNGLRAGTVHRAQGREADVVVLVLGGDPRKPGARNWVAEKPNLFNVAVSRAKRRLYVVGDRADWSGRRYFGALARRLAVWE